MSDFSGFYYPYASIDRQEVLKRAFLYFDKVYILDPFTTHKTFTTDLTPLLEATKAVPRETSRRIHNTHAQKRAAMAMILDLARRTTDQTDKLFSDYHFLQRMKEVEEFQKGSTFLQEAGVLEVVHLSKELFTDKQVAALNMLASGVFIDAQESEVHTDEAAWAILFAIIIEMSNRLASTPFTDSEENSALLRQSIENLLKFGKESAAFDTVESLARLSGHNSFPIQSKADTIGIQLISRELPNFELQSYDDILELRYKLREELGRFRLEMRQIAADITTNPWSEDFRQDIDRVIAKQLDPALAELRRKLSLSNDKFIQKLFKEIKSGKPTIPFVASLFTGFPLYASFLISAAIVGADILIDSYFEKREILESSGLSYLMRFD